MATTTLRNGPRAGHSPSSRRCPRPSSTATGPGSVRRRRPDTNRNHHLPHGCRTRCLPSRLGRHPSMGAHTAGSGGSRSAVVVLDRSTPNGRSGLRVSLDDRQRTTRRPLRYVSSLVPYMIVGLLPEDTASLDGEFDVIRTEDQGSPGLATSGGSDAGELARTARPGTRNRPSTPEAHVPKGPSPQRSTGRTSRANRRSYPGLSIEGRWETVRRLLRQAPPSETIAFYPRVHAGVYWARPPSPLLPTLSSGLSARDPLLTVFILCLDRN